MATLSLKKSFIRKTILPFIIVAALLILVVWGFGYSLKQSQADSVLEYRVNVLEVSFSAYLDRAEFEAKYLAQKVSNDGSLDSLFQLHDILFFGGLDFFYIEQANKAPLEDPRARLYTHDSLTKLAGQSRLNYWRHISTNDGAELLVLKKPLQTDEDHLVQGYLYGFVSLNNNLALSSDLMAGAKVDYMQISDVSGRQLLEDQLPTFTENDSAISYTGILQLPVLEDKLTVDVKMAKPFADSLGQGVLANASVVIICLSILFWSVVHNAYRWMFQPLENLSTNTESEKKPVYYQEFASFKQQMNRFQAQLKARDQHLELLLNSLQSAILFCDESARLTAINDESKTIFPDYLIAKTIFDMTPIAFHQPIQRALKGFANQEFELELPELGKTYKWHTYSFINEYGFRSVMLVGRDISEVRYLRHQLEHFAPRHTLDRPCPDAHVILNELEVLRTGSEHHTISSQYWLILVGHLLDRVGEAPSADIQCTSLGELIVEQQNALDKLAIPNDKYGVVEYDIPMDEAQKQADWSEDHKTMLQIILLLCMSDSILTRRISAHWDTSGLVITVSGITHITPAMSWMLQEFPRVVKGHAIVEENVITFMMNLAVKEDRAPDVAGRRHIALIENDYDDISYCSSVLMSLRVRLDRYLSFEEFLSSSRAMHSAYDLIIVAIGDDNAANKGVEKLQSLSPEHRIPLLYVSDRNIEQAVEAPIVFSHQLMPYRFLMAISDVVADTKVNLGDWLSLGSSWLILGGSDINQIIWQAELQSMGIVARREHDISQLANTVKPMALSVILLLDKHCARALQAEDVELDGVQWVVLEDFRERPDTMLYFDMHQQPPSSDLVASLIQRLNKEKG